MMEQGCRLYLITPPHLDPGEFRDHLSAALNGGDVAAVQLRLGARLRTAQLVGRKQPVQRPAGGGEQESEQRPSSVAARAQLWLAASHLRPRVRL